VHDRLGTTDVVDPGVWSAQVADDRLDAGRDERVDLSRVAGESDHRVAAGDELVGGGRTDEPGGTGDEAAHQRARIATTPAVMLQTMPTGTMRNP
jgi:hypothetical protein